MNIGIIALAVPVFLLAIGLEYFFSRRKNRDVYRFRDTFSNLLIGMGSEIVGVLVAVVKIAAYHFFFVSYSLNLLNDGLVLWVVALLGVDFCYYWYHRFSHEVNMLWCFHVVHHQSREYNLSVALRQSWFGGIVGWIFYIPLAVIGVPSEVFATSMALNLLFQFFVHTRLVGRLGVFELVFNTPSHHRVHHGSDYEYLDKNYAGALIIWDRFFGTFVQEQHEPHYGIVKPFTSYNPLSANVQPLGELIVGSKRFSKWKNKIGFWLRPPGWEPGDAREDTAIRTKLAVENMATISTTPYRNRYFIAYSLLALTTLATVAFMVWGGSWSIDIATALVVLMIFPLYCFGRWLGSESISSDT